MRAERTGESLSEAAAAVGVGSRTAYRHAGPGAGTGRPPSAPGGPDLLAPAGGIHGAAAVAAIPVPIVASGAPVDRLRAYAAHDEEALRVLADLLADDEAPDAVTTLDRVRKLIRRTERRALDAKEARFGTLAGVLDRLYARERLLQGPPPAPPDAVLAELRRLDGEVLARIEALADEPIAPHEVAAA